MLNHYRHVLKTNFYQPTKVALSFRLAPDFLPAGKIFWMLVLYHSFTNAIKCDITVEYPNKPFGMFIIIGNEFRGFHVRFRDVARGGIRIVMSRNKEYMRFLDYYSILS
jgi:glutamate dehydrogenase